MKYSIVNRSWQKGAGLENHPFKKSIFKERLGDPISLMLRTSNDEFCRIVVVVNADQRFPQFLGEKLDVDGTTPTVRALRQEFGDSIDVLVEENWGNNAGSAMALNTGWQYAAENHGIDRVLSWNTEMALTGHHVAQMSNFMFEHSLEVVGFLREEWYLRPQFHFFQNTAAMYRVTSLKEVGGFNERCDCKDGSTIETERLGRVPLAGMDDQDFLMRLFKKRGGEMPRIGMVGWRDPAPWQTSWPNEPARQEMFEIKVERQYRVIGAWAEINLPGITVEEYLKKVFRSMFIGP